MSHDFARSQRLKKESARKPVRKKSGGVPSWLWVLVGTLVGGLIMFLVYLSGVAPQLPDLQSAQTAPAEAKPEQKPSETPAPPKRVSPVFEFYTKLPEGGPPVTDLPSETSQAALPATTSPTATSSTATTDTPPVAVPPVETADPIQQLLAERTAAQAVATPADPVKPEAAKTEPAKPESVKPEVAKKETAKPPAGRYLQAGVFRNKAEVEKLRARIAMLGIKPNVQTITNAKGETLQKVTVGPFSSADAMTDAKIILDGNGVSTIPVK
jgi:cell division protein FtsN